MSIRRIVGRIPSALFFVGVFFLCVGLMPNTASADWIISSLCLDLVSCGVPNINTGCPTSICCAGYIFDCECGKSCTGLWCLCS